MVEETKKTTKKATAPKAAKAEKAAAPKKAAKKAPTGKTLTVKQVRSPLGRTQDQFGTLTGLGLGKLNRTKVLEDTPAVRGMINKVKHLVVIVDEAA